MKQICIYRQFPHISYRGVPRDPTFIFSCILLLLLALFLPFFFLTIGYASFDAKKIDPVLFSVISTKPIHVLLLKAKFHWKYPFFLQILAKIEMIRSKHRLFGHHFKTVQHTAFCRIMILYSSYINYVQISLQNSGGKGASIKPPWARERKVP